MTQVSRKGFVDKEGKQVVLTDPTKADKVQGATAGNFACLDANGNPTDSGKKPADFAPVVHDHDTIAHEDSDGLSRVYTTSSEEDGGEVYIMVKKGNGNYKSAIITDANINNLIRALANPDSTPTADSDNLVTSGGLKTALDNAANKIDGLIRSTGETDSIGQTIIKIDGAVSEGIDTGAVDNNTHAEGVHTVAAGRASHAEGDGGGDEVEIDVTQLWVVRNPTDDQGEIDDHSLYVSCGVGYTIDRSVSVGYVIMYRGVNGPYQYAKIQEIRAVAGEENLFALLLSSPIQVNVTSDSRSKTLYKIPSGALGRASHVEGLGTIAKANYQHVQGKYNVADTNGDYAYIIGNGTADDERSNAFAVKWDGTIVVWNNGTTIELSPATLAALMAPDATPTADSNKLVTSGGVKTALDGKVNKLKEITISDDDGSYPGVFEIPPSKESDFSNALVWNKANARPVIVNIGVHINNTPYLFKAIGYIYAEATEVQSETYDLKAYICVNGYVFMRTGQENRQEITWDQGLTKLSSDIFSSNNNN